MLSWPDFGTPDEDEFSIIENIIEKIKGVEDDERNKDKIIVH